MAGAAATLAFGLPGARAAGPATRLRAGEFELSVISDGHLVLPTNGLAPDAPALERTAALAAAGQSEAQFASPTNVTLIRAGAELILVDAGSGPHFMPTAGKLAGNLAAAGIAPEAVTTVVFTHGHPDHLWGTIDDLDELTFPNAGYVVAAAEWDFWTGENATRGLPADRLVFVQAARRNFQRIKDKVRMVKPGDDIVAGLRVVETGGHTQGHVSLEVAGSVLVTGDALTHPVISFAHPRWRMAADHEPERAVETRLALLDRLATDKTRLVGFHLPYPGVGRVERKDGAYRFVTD
jgi:glyoxylase-like metal-dependent hydrolase (beta-lactamase superfamily II)